MNNICFHVYCFIFLLKDGVYGNSNSTDTSSVDTTGLKVGISFAVLTGGLLIATLIAKLVNMCMSRRHTVADSKGQISDTTQDLIQTRLALIRMKQRDIERDKASKGPDIKGILIHWRELVRKKLKAREKEKPPKNAKMVLSIDKVNEVTQNKAIVTNNTVSPRLSVFVGAQNGVRKSSKDTPNNRNSPTKMRLSPTKSNSVLEKERSVSPVKPTSAAKLSNGNIPNRSTSAKVNTLSTKQSNIGSEKETPIRPSPNLISSSPVDGNILLGGNKQTTMVTQIQEQNTESQPPDICS